jgi:hypothetical protein
MQSDTESSDVVGFASEGRSTRGCVGSNEHGIRSNFGSVRNSLAESINDDQRQVAAELVTEESISK